MSHSEACRRVSWRMTLLVNGAMALAVLISLPFWGPLLVIVLVEAPLRLWDRIRGSPPKRKVWPRLRSKAKNGGTAE